MQKVVRREYDWALTGAKDRSQRVLSSIYLDVPTEEKVNLRILGRYREAEKNEVRYKEYYIDDADYIVIGFGTAGRVAVSAVRAARAQGIKVGLFRPISVHPYPTKRVEELCKQAQSFLVVEMNTGQMLKDVQFAVKDKVPIRFYGRLGGILPFPDEILSEIQAMIKNPPKTDEDPRNVWFKRMTSKK
jgi:2-oxoglutarate ferredoxin oxidoreductase subunit alpha